MRTVHVALVLTAALATGACFQSTTLIRVNEDGSGTVEQTTLLGAAALAQMRQLGGGAGGKALDPFSEEQERAAAARIGEGVEFVSSAPIVTAAGEGRTSLYRFADISRLHVNQRPPTPGGVTVRTGDRSTNPGEDVRFAMTKQPNGNALLTITFPEAKTPPSDQAPAPTDPPPPDQVAMMKQMLAGLRIAIAVEPAGRLVHTSSPFVEGQKVTLLDMDFDRLLQDDTLAARIQSLKSIEDAKQAMKTLPGVKVNLERQVTIEFAPR